MKATLIDGSLYQIYVKTELEDEKGKKVKAYVPTEQVDETVLIAELANIDTAIDKLQEKKQELQKKVDAIVTEKKSLK
jgi:predicted RNase H-like nuclease (RuvC/YqgF family)